MLDELSGREKLRVNVDRVGEFKERLEGERPWEYA